MSLASGGTQTDATGIANIAKQTWTTWTTYGAYAVFTISLLLADFSRGIAGLKPGEIALVLLLGVLVVKRVLARDFTFAVTPIDFGFFLLIAAGTMLPLMTVEARSIFITKDMLNALVGPAAPPLVLMGWTEPEEEAKLRARIAELGLKNVQFIGPKHGDEMVSILQYSRFVVVPSIWYENTPHTTYEAFGAGRPAIVTNLGSLPEQVTHEQNSLLFEHGNPQDFAKQMQRLIDNPTYADWLGANGAQLVRSEFSGERHIERTLGLFNSLLGISPGEADTLKRGVVTRS